MSACDPFALKNSPSRPTRPACAARRRSLRAHNIRSTDGTWRMAAGSRRAASHRARDTAVVGIVRLATCHWPPRQLPIYRIAARASRASTSSPERRPREGVDQTSSSATAAARRNDNLARLSAVVRRNGEGAAALRRARGARAAESRRAREGVQDVEAAGAALPRRAPSPALGGHAQHWAAPVRLAMGSSLWPQCRLERFGQTGGLAAGAILSCSRPRAGHSER